MKVAIVGGGVIGLSIAYELSTRAHDVIVLEKQRLGRQASWAGAGILPPSNGATAIHPLEHLEAKSDQLHPEWADRLKRETGIDTGYQRCGGLYIARSHGEQATLLGRALDWEERQIEFRALERGELNQKFPALAIDVRDSAQAWWAPGESQICNPHHVQALILACAKRGVELVEHCVPPEMVCGADGVEQVRSGDRIIDVDACCLAAGPWSSAIAKNVVHRHRPANSKHDAQSDQGEALPMVPVRGQMLLYKLDRAPLAAVVNEGTRYLVPRRDGYVLFGATIEAVGFDDSTTDEGIQNLKRHAQALVPELADQRLVNTWAGLRPATFDGFPYLGGMPQAPNLIVATGHFKAGLHLSPGTAEVISDLVEGTEPSIDLRPFAPSRAQVNS